MIQRSNPSKERTATPQTRRTWQESLQRLLELTIPKTMHFTALSIRVSEREDPVEHSSHQRTTVFRAETPQQTTTWPVMASAATTMNRARECLRDKAKETEGNKCTSFKIPLISQVIKKLQEAVSDQYRPQDPATSTSSSNRPWFITLISTLLIKIRVLSNPQTPPTTQTTPSTSASYQCV